MEPLLPLLLGKIKENVLEVLQITLGEAKIKIK
jgi:hypothetical protein